MPKNCYYQPSKICWAQYPGDSPPGDWCEVKCEVCERVVGHACPDCAEEEATEGGCWEAMCEVCHRQRIPPPTPPSPDAERRKEELRRALEGGSQPHPPSSLPNYWPTPPPTWPPPPEGDEGT